MTSPAVRSIVDAHVHWYDNVGAHGDGENPQPALDAGAAAGLPSAHLPDAYRSDITGYHVDGIVWHECEPDDVLNWAQRRTSASILPQAMVARIDFLDPLLEERLEVYKSLPILTAVSEHHGWDPANRLRRFAKRPDLLRDPAWLRGVACLRKHDLKCVLQVFSPQLADLLHVVRSNPDIGFALPMMGWPLELTATGFSDWWKGAKALSRYDNVVVDISAIEWIFGANWNATKIAPWLLSLIEMFGPGRCMFGSHLPVTRLSRGFRPLYDTYQHLTRNFSACEQDQMFRTVAIDWFGVR